MLCLYLITAERHLLWLQQNWFFSAMVHTDAIQMDSFRTDAVCVCRQLFDVNPGNDDKCSH
ncbi:hypothetical protein T09_10984 [Trichinella sp. T9]|nr:hypothetical protein T09_10984 [Trichinella sp. T9]